MVKDHSDGEERIHGLFFPISSKFIYIYIYTTAFFTPKERDVAQR